MDYGEAIRRKPDFPEAYLNRGNAKVRLGLHKAAIADFDEAIRQKPDYADAYLNRGIVKDKMRQYEDAIVDYGEAIRRKPDYAEAYLNRGIVKDNMGRRGDAGGEPLGGGGRVSHSGGSQGGEAGPVKREKPVSDEDLPSVDEIKTQHFINKFRKAMLDNRETYIDRWLTATAIFLALLGVLATLLGVLACIGILKRNVLTDHNGAPRLKPDYPGTYLNRGIASVALGDEDAAGRDFEKARDLARAASDEEVAANAEQALKKLDDWRVS